MASSWHFSALILDGVDLGTHLGSYIYCFSFYIFYIIFQCGEVNTILSKNC